VTMSLQSKYWGDVSPLSHRDRRPCARYASFSTGFLTSGDLNLRPFELKIGTPITRSYPKKTLHHFGCSTLSS